MYKIDYREYPLKLRGLPLAGISHSFIALSKDNKTIEEIHGSSFDKDTECPIGLRYLFNRLSGVELKLRTMELRDKETPYTSSIPLNESQDLFLWKKFKRLAREINKTNTNYSITSNCHSVSNTIVTTSLGVSLEGSSKYFRPGLTRRIF